MRATPVVDGDAPPAESDFRVRATDEKPRETETAGGQRREAVDRQQQPGLRAHPCAGYARLPANPLDPGFCRGPFF